MWGGAVVRVWGGGIGVYWGASARTTRYHDLHVMSFVMWFLLVNGEVLVSARPPLAHPHGKDKSLYCRAPVQLWVQQRMV